MDSNHSNCLPNNDNTHRHDPKSNVEPKPPPGGPESANYPHASASEPHTTTTTSTTPATSKSHPASAGKPLPNKLNDISLQQIPTEELLGSVTTFYPGGDAECGHALRTSARVIHKMRMDSIRGSTPPPPDRKESGGGGAGGGRGGAGVGGAGCQAKTPNQTKQVRVVWSNQDKNLFFEALNECGKDFEGIANYLNTKKRRKDSSSEHAFKVKDVRHLYYQFNQKVSKYLHFSDEVKKEAQELYGLINYGEMRKKVPFQNKKYFHKLKDLVYKGFTTIREKGKNIRIKTPSCRALRKLNQLEEWQEEIRLPPRVDVILKPASVAAWGRVQSLAQNPRVKTSVTLQKRVSTLLQLLQLKWRHQDVRLMERMTSMKAASQNVTPKAARVKTQHELELCTRMTVDCADGEGMKVLRFTPSKDAVIHRPMINLTEFMSSYSICLNSYEQRIGAKVRGEVLCSEKLNSFKERMGANSKRQRHDSGSEKHSPDGKKVKAEPKEIKEEKTGEGGSAIANFAGVFKSPNASNESLEAAAVATATHKEIDGSDGECQSGSAANKSGGGLSIADISSDGPDLKSPESNDSIKLSGVSKIKFDLLEVVGVVSSAQLGENSNDGALSENEQQQPASKQVKSEEQETATVAATSSITHDDLIKTTVKRKEAKEKCGKRKDSKTGTTSGLNNLHFRPLISEEAMQKIREGWTVQSVGDLTIGDLYIMFGEENKLHLEYFWEMPKEEKTEAVATAEGMETVVDLTKDGVAEGSNCNGSAAAVISDGEVTAVAKSSNVYEPNLSGRLKQLLQIASLIDKTGKRRCPCGHVCDRKHKNIDPMTSASTMNDNLLFKQPLLPTRLNAGATLANCNILPSPHSRYKQSRWWRMRVNRQQLPSQQRLMLPNGSASPYPSPVVGTSAGASASRVNNNVYAPTPGNSKLLLTNGGGMVAGPSTSSTVSSGHTGKSSTSSPSNDEDHLSKLLEDKISRISSSGASSSSNSKSSMAVVETTSGSGVGDDSLSLFDISLPSTSSTLIADLMSGGGSGSSVTSAAAGEDTSATTISATRILRESPVDGKLIETDINDISLSSFLGHLDAVYQSQTPVRRRESDQMNISIISESSVDYIARFEDIAAELRAQQQEQDSV